MFLFLLHTSFLHNFLTNFASNRYLENRFIVLHFVIKYIALDIFFNGVLLSYNLGSPNKGKFVIFFPLRSNTAWRRMTLLMIKIMRKLFTCSFAPIVGTYSFNIPQVPGIPFYMSNLQKYLHLILHVFHWNVYLLINLVAIYLNVIDKGLRMHWKLQNYIWIDTNKEQIASTTQLKCTLCMTFAYKQQRTYSYQ